MSAFTRVRAHVAALLGVVLWLGTVAAQDILPGPGRRVSSPAAGPAIDRGWRGASRAMRKAGDLQARRIGTTARYVPGGVIVKFRLGTSTAARNALVALIGGRLVQRPSYATFDIISVDAGADPEAIARRLAAQPDVQFAQARYRARPLMRPNDPQYSLQWNLSTLDMERAWDINPGATSSVIVAVLDSGMAYTNTSFTLTQNSPQEIQLSDDDSFVYPALGTVNLSFAAATDLASPSRFVAPSDFIWVDATPVEVSAGYRFRPQGRQQKLIPYVGGGIGWHRYSETSTFATEGEDVSETFTGFHGLGGVEYRLGRWYAVAGEAQWTSVPDAIGDSPGSASEAFDESNLGGLSFRVRFVIGR